MAQTHTILLVDDEDNSRFAMSRFLEARGTYHVVCAESAEEALAHLRDADVDLVITDIKMPGIDGFELVTWLKANRPKIRVVMTTAYGSLQVREQSMKLGALHYMEKPVDLEKLKDYLHSLFKQDSWQGSIRDLDLFGYIQLVTATTSNLVLRVTSGGQSGELYIRNGQIVHAACGDSLGEDAFYTIFNWSGGEVEDLQWIEPEQTTIDQTTSYLLVEAARRRDEFRSGLHPIVPIPPHSAATPPTIPSPLPPPEVFSHPEVHPNSHYEAALTTMDEVKGILGALLLPTEGANLASRGEMPEGIESLILPLTKGCLMIGEELGLGRYDSAVLHLEGGEQLWVEPLGRLLLGIRISGKADMTEVRAWVREVARRAG